MLRKETSFTAAFSGVSDTGEHIMFSPTMELLLFCLFFTENLDGIWENLDFFWGLKLMDFGERNLRSLWVFKQSQQSDC